MGQQCSNIQNRVQGNLFKDLYQIESSQLELEKNKKRHQEKLSNDIKKITLIQNSAQLIYQFYDSESTVKKLQFQNWEDKVLVQSLQILQFCYDNSFLVRIHLSNHHQPVWKIISIVTVDGFSTQSIYDFGKIYYTFCNIKHIQPISQSFVYADKCYLKLPKQQNQLPSFIMQSQVLSYPPYSLKKLGCFMKKNDICWQDGQFSHIIFKCCQILEKMHQNHLISFKDFLIDQKTEIHCVGGLIVQPKDPSKKRSQDKLQLCLYLASTLYGQQITASSKSDFISILSQHESNSKFKHPKSIEELQKLYEIEKTLCQNLKNKPTNEYFVNIQYYISSYEIKNVIQPSLFLSERYHSLDQYQKAKQVLLERLRILTYRQGSIESKQIRVNQGQKNRITIKNISNSDFDEVFQIFQNLIVLQKKMSYYTHSFGDLVAAIREYQAFALYLANQQRRKQNLMNSLTILHRAKHFLQEKHTSWQIDLYLGQTYFLMGKIDETQKNSLQSIKVQVNEANACFLIYFYASVLSWEKAFALITEYEKFISQDYIYEFLIAKILLSKALCLSSKQNQDQSKKYFHQCINVAKRVEERKNIPQVLLCECYEIIADSYFYSKQYKTARELYDKGLAISSLVDFARRKALNLNIDQNYEPTFLQSQSLDQSRSLSFSQKNQSSLKKHSLSKQPIGHSTFDSVISQNQQKQTSFIYQLDLFLNLNKKAIFLSSTANCLFMEKRYSQAIKIYQEARNQVSQSDSDLKNSIIGNMALCYVEMAKVSQNKQKKRKLQQGKRLLEHVISCTQQQNPSKLQKDINYIFLLKQLQKI